MLQIPAATLRTTTERIFTAAGATPTIAAVVADALVLANLAGHDSHGVIRIPAYVKQIQAGRLAAAAEPTVIKRQAATVLVDGHNGFGQVAGRFATDQAIAAAKEYGAAAVVVTNCNHVGRVGEYPERAAAADVLLFATCGGVGGGGLTAPFGGRAGILGTNPIAIGLPAGQRPPMIIDFATTVVAEGKVQVARAKGAELPPGAILDKAGRPSLDPNDLYDGGTMLPFGGHKGFGLSLVAAVLSQGLSGSPGSFFLWAVAAGAFGSLADYAGRVDWMIEQVKAVPPAAGVSEVLVPGEPERRERARRAAEGVPVAEATWQAIGETASQLGVAEAARL
jgi:LDH2 family malate/lactate/ureidoglycolate dehydrogenase